MLLSELVRDVITNPAAHAGQFPVAELPEDDYNSYNRLPRGGFFPELEHYQREFLEHMARITSTVADFDGGLPYPNVGARQRLISAPFDRGLPNTATGVEAMMTQIPLRRDSVAQRILDSNRNRVAPWGDRNEGEGQGALYPTQTHDAPPRINYRSFPDMNGPTADLSGAQITPEQFDEAHRRVRGSTPPRMEWRAYGDGDGGRGARQDFIAIDDVDHPTRPDHYQVRGGECACGFRTIWRADMDAHLEGRQVTDQYGVVRQWMLCECGESRLCRQVLVPSIVVPDSERIYLCDDCCARRGIR